VALDDKLAITLGDMGRLGAVRATTAARKVEQLTQSRLVYTLRARHQTSGNIGGLHLSL